jgi:SHS2 domain-containing protein
LVYNSDRRSTLRYTFLDHTADAEFRAFGADLAEALANAALAVASLMWDWDKVMRNVSRAVDVRGRDLPQLVSRYLEEVVFLFESEGFLLAGVDGLHVIKEDHAYRLQAVFWGDKLSARYPLHGAVKAVTYNDMKIEEGDRAMVQVVVDV